MTFTVTLDCGCSIALISDGEYHRPEAPKPCAAHTFIAARSTMVLALLGTRVKVKMIEDEAREQKKLFKLSDRCVCGHTLAVHNADFHNCLDPTCPCNRFVFVLDDAARDQK